MHPQRASPQRLCNTSVTPLAAFRVVYLCVYPVQRREGYGAYHEPGRSVIAPEDATSASFLPSKARFANDFATEDRRAREAAFARKQAELARRREEVSLHRVACVTQCLHADASPLR